jgi:hypothetical protein
VVENNLEKMVRRHPHVFGDVTARTAEKVSENWEKIKLKEKGAAGRAPVLSSIPQSLPALLRASMVSERAAKTGFDWDDISGVMDKTMEEWKEFSAEVNDPARCGRWGKGGHGIRRRFVHHGQCRPVRPYSPGNSVDSVCPFRNLKNGSTIWKKEQLLPGGKLTALRCRICIGYGRRPRVKSADRWVDPAFLWKTDGTRNTESRRPSRLSVLPKNIASKRVRLWAFVPVAFGK